MHIFLKAYIKVAKKRVIDCVVNTLNSQLNKLSEKISIEIHATDELLETLVGDDRATKAKRSQLKAEIETCSKALSEFKKLAIY